METNVPDRDMASQAASTKRIKICFVGLYNLPVLAREYSQHGIGGEQVQQTLLARAFARRGFDVSMVTSDYGQPEAASWDGITVYRAYRADSGLPLIRFFYPRWTSVWSALRRADADVYYISCADMLVGQVVHFASQHDRKTVFRVAHDRDCTPENLLIKYRRDRLIYEYGLRRVNTVLVQSEFQQSTLRQNYGLEGIVARMLVDRPQSIIALQDRFIDMLWVNNFRDFKRPDRYLSLANSLPELQSHMIGGPIEYQRELFAQMAARATSIPTLTFHGQVPYHAVNENYAHARVFVNTSDSEGFPNSYLQAWVRGTPVVAFFDPDGTIEREGLGFAVKDDNQMRAAVRHLTQDARLWAATSKRCIEFMHRVYNEDDILTPYRAALCNARPQPRS